MPKRRFNHSEMEFAIGEYITGRNAERNRDITVPCGCCVSVSAAYVDATEDDAAVTPTPSIFVRRRASLSVVRVA